jgi:environmental stress-induced protein Ves|tara:strand:+ start:4842 stop:5471 length:630 start_codon:yes stop_codon:yes gene_type:complete
MMLNTQLQYQIIQRSDYKPMPWKNGLGETLEIWRVEDERNLRFRISQASVVENGMFSDFNGLTRILVLLTGNGVTLEHRSKSGCNSNQLNEALDMARFSGGDKTYATLIKGEIEDLNIMVRELDTIAKVEAHFAPTGLFLSQEATLFTAFYANEETIVAYQNENMAEPQTLYLSSQSLLYINKNKRRVLQLISGSGVLIEINLTAKVTE